MAKEHVGKILWRDLTVEHAGQVKDFYEKVVGWKTQPCDMGGYEDYSMVPPEEEDAVAGVCHARGANAVLPPQWLLYIGVEDLDASLAQVKALGGKLVTEPAPLSGGRFCVIEDPAGAVCALYQT